MNLRNNEVPDIELGLGGPLYNAESFGDLLIKHWNYSNMEVYLRRRIQILRTTIQLHFVNYRRIN